MAFSPASSRIFHQFIVCITLLVGLLHVVHFGLFPLQIIAAIEMVNLARDCIDIFVQWRNASQIHAGDYRADICSDETRPAGASETEPDDTRS